RTRSPPAHPASPARLPPVRYPLPSSPASPPHRQGITANPPVKLGRCRRFRENPQASYPLSLRCAGPARLGPRNNLAVLSTPKPRTHSAFAERDPLVWDPAAERPAAAEIGGRPHQFEMRPMLSD